VGVAALAPTDEAPRRVPCIDHVGTMECGCRSEGRTALAVKTFPESREEFRRRLRVLMEQGQSEVEGI
jgi:hypothetical protein